MNPQRIAALLLSTWAVLISQSVSAASTASYKAIPPFLAVNSPKPNVLIVLDNSNSMDESANGEAVGSSNPTSRSEIARNALKGILATYQDQIRFGLMGYRQQSSALSNIHNSYYYASYDPGTYDPAGTFTPRDRDTAGVNQTTVIHTNTRQVELQAGRWVYYDRALPYYSGSNEGVRYCYSTSFSPRQDPAPPVTNKNVNIAQDNLGNDYVCCTGKAGSLDISPDGVNNDASAIAQYSGCTNNYNFGLTDSDVAEGFWQIGSQHAWRYVAPSCLSDQSPSGGFLQVAVDESSSSQMSSLNGKLATWTSATGCGEETTPMSNAGFTPLASTLGSTRDYFQGTLVGSQTAIHATPPTPMQQVCQRNFVVLVTDGLPTDDLNANGNFIDDSVEKAAALRNTPITVNSSTVNCDIQTFVLGFALPQGAAGALDPIAVAGGTAVDGHAYYAGNEAELNAALGSLFLEILQRSSSGTATAINMSSFRGEGMAIRATFQPKMSDGTRTVRWTGHLNALFIDDAGDLHEDDGDGVLEDASADPYVDMCYDTTNKVTRVKNSTSQGARPSPAEVATCSSGTFNKLLEDIKSLWDGGRWLAGLPATGLATQRSYAGTGPGRYILTGIDADADGLVSSSEQREFLAESFTDANAGLLLASSGADAGVTVNYIRGQDQDGLRSRSIHLNGIPSTWRLGDIVYSSPAVVGRPAENFDLLYRDTSYKEFFEKYRNRRQMVYVGANDGMLHAFNAGYYDAPNKRFIKGGVGFTQYDLGAELWAYVPYNLLPHLRYLWNPSYGSTSDDHVYYVDLKPRVFDAKIFASDTTHPGGWGTVLVAGTRLGGGEIDVDADLTSAESSDWRTLRSSYFIFDITDPEQEPRLLLEFTHPDLGYSLSTPAPIAVCTARDENQDCTAHSWYLMLGSGPHPANQAALLAGSSDQNARLFLLDLATLSLADGFGTQGIQQLPDQNSMISDLVAVDYNLDYSADSVYFGTIKGSAGSWSGNLQRVRIVNQENTASPWTYKPLGDWSPSLVLDTARPIMSMPAVAVDSSKNRWLMVGSGRFLVQGDLTDFSSQRFYGVKEPRDHDSGGAFTWGTASGLLDVSNVEVYQNSEAVSGLSGSLSPGSPCAPNGTTTVDTFAELECYLRQYQLESDYQGGWYQYFATGARSIGEAAVLAGALTYTGYTPSSALCEAEGSSTLTAVYFGTGTGYRKPIIGLNTGITLEGNPAMLTEISLGTGAAVTPSLHTGAGYADCSGAGCGQSKAFIQNSTGTSMSVTENNPFVIRPGEISWREHRD